MAGSNEKKEEWYLSKDGEYYGVTAYDSYDDALCAGLNMWESVKSGKERFTDLFDKDDAEYGFSKFYIGRRMEWWHAVDEDTVLCEAQDDADDYAGEFAEGWLDDVTSEERQKLRDALQEAFDKWIADTKREPTFFMIRQSSEVDANDYEVVDDGR